MIRCGFCAYEFDPASAEQACSGCPVVSDCHLVRCPRCGYEMPPESRLITWVQRIIERSRGGSPKIAAAARERNGIPWI